MTHVYILTETGKGFNKKGIDHVRNTLSANSVDIDDLIIDSGPDLNQPKDFANLLKSKSSSWIVLSTNDNIFYAPPAIKDEFVQLLFNADNDQTSWQILTTAIAKHKK